MHFNLIILALYSLFNTLSPIPDKIIWAAAWHPDGQIAVGGNQDSLYLFSDRKYQLEKTFPIENTITQLKWHPTKKLLAISTQTSNTPSAILNYEDGTFHFLGSIGPVGARGLDWNHTGAMLAVGDNDGDIFLFSSDGKLLKKVPTTQKAITALTWHPQKNVLVSVGSHIVIYDHDSGAIQEIQPRPNEVLMLCAQWHPSGKFFVTGDYGDYEQDFPALLQFWNAEGEKIREIEAGKAEYRNLDWSPNGKYLATASDALRIWSAEGKLLKEGPSPGLLWGVSWDGKGKKLVTTSENEVITIWNSRAKIKEQLSF